MSKKRLVLPSRKFWYAVAAAAVLIVVIIPTFIVQSKGPMLAILPFEYSGPPEKEYYAESLSDEITRGLEKLSAVGVISSSSTSGYRNSPGTPAEIGRELGADYLLIGTIRWDTAGKIAKLRILPRLVRAEDQAGVWTEPFEIVWGEICNLPGVVTRKIVAALNVELLEPERQSLESCPTGNIEAYEAYLRGNRHFNQPRDVEPLQSAVEMYQKAVHLDSAFALAYTMLARASVELYWHHLWEKPLLEAARQALDKALQLQPGLPEARLALGSYYYHAAENDSALTQFYLIERTLANNSDLWEEMGFTFRRKGEWERAVGALEKSFTLDPKDHVLALQIGYTHASMGNRKETERYFDIALALAPESRPYYEYKARLYRGDIAKGKRFLGEPKRSSMKSSQAST